VVQSLVDCAFFWFALMLFEIGLQLELSFVRIDKKFLSCAED